VDRQNTERAAALQRQYVALPDQTNWKYLLCADGVGMSWRFSFQVGRKEGEAEFQ
jgi:hypothetical protein